MSVVSCSTTSTTAYKVTADTTGTLVLQTGASPTTAMTIDGSQNVTLAGNITLNNGAADGAQLSLSSAGFSDWNIDNYSGNFRWYYNATEYMRLSNSGNLGLGVTPSVWYSTYKALQLGSAASIVGRSDSSGTEYSSNVYRDAGATYKYIASDYASAYRQYSGIHSWFTAASGTAGNAISFTQAMTLDASGRLGIGTTSPAQKLDVVGSAKISNSDTTQTTLFASNSAGSTEMGVFPSGIGYYGTTSNTALTFYTNSSERARIDSSGRLLVGTTSQPSSSTKGFGVVPNSTVGYFIASGVSITTTCAHAEFYNPNGTVGSITTNSSSTTYATSSDYRLKENIAPMTGALATVAALKPCTYTWKATGEDGQGFIAHELQAVVPDAVVGEKDGTRIEQYEISPAVPATFDEEGNELTPAVEAVMGEREVPVYQGIDTSFLVATLTAAIQEQQAIIETLTNRITALETK